MAILEPEPMSGHGLGFSPPAREILQPWADFPISRIPRPIVFLDSPVHLGEHGFVDGAAKVSWLAGAIEAKVPLMVGLIDVITQGRSRRAAPEVLTITNVEQCDEEFVCDRGARHLPAYRLEIRGLREPCIVLAPAVECWWPAHDLRGHAGGVKPHATVSDDGLTVSLTASGGFLTEFHRAEFIEFPTCVVGHAVTSERPNPTGAPVRAGGVHRKVAGHLTTPLDGRVLLDTAGEPVAVVAAGG